MMKDYANIIVCFIFSHKIQLPRIKDKVACNLDDTTEIERLCNSDKWTLEQPESQRQTPTPVFRLELLPVIPNQKVLKEQMRTNRKSFKCTYYFYCPSCLMRNVSLNFNTIDTARLLRIWYIVNWRRALHPVNECLSYMCAKYSLWSWQGASRRHALQWSSWNIHKIHI